MAHKVHIGQQFDSFLAFESFKERYQNTEYVQFYRRDSRTVEASAARCPKKTLNPAIKFYEATYHCVRGGKKHKPTGTGRPYIMHQLHSMDFGQEVRRTMRVTSIREEGCAPAPGTYDPKSGDKAAGGVVDKTERFRTPKETGSAPGSANSSTIVTSTPVKQLFAPPQSIKRPPKSSTSTADASKVKELEKEIKHLLKERADQDKLLSNKDDEVKKLEGRLLHANSDKSSLQAKMAAAEKELQAMKKLNELLKNKVSAAENNKKQDQLKAEVTSLRQQLQQKEGEITQLKRDLQLAVTTLVSHLQLFESSTLALEKQAETYGRVVRSLLEGSTEKDSEKKNNKKEDKKNDIEVKLKNEKTSVEEKMTLVKKQTQLLSERFTKALKELSSVSQQMESAYTNSVKKQSELQEGLGKVQTELKEALDIKQALEEQKADLLDSNSNLNDKVKEMIAETQQKEDGIRNLQLNIEELQENNTSLQAKLQEVEQFHQQTLKEDADRIISLEERELVIQVVTKGLNERIVELQAQNEDLLAALGENEKILEQTKIENGNLEGFIEELKENFEQERTVFMNQFEELEREKLKVDSSLYETEQKVTELQADFEKQRDDSEAQVKGLQEQLEVNKTELEQLQNKLGDLVYEKSQLHTEIGHMEAKLKLLNCESEKTREDADNAFEAIPKLKEEINILLIEKKKAEDQIGELIAQNASLQGTLEVFQSDFDGYVETAENEKTVMHDKIVELTQEVDGLKEQKDHMAKELDDWLTEKSELDVDIAKLQCRIKVLEMENEQANTESEKQAKCQRDEIDRLRVDKQRLEQDLSTETARLKSLQSELECQVTDHTQLEEKFQQLEVQFDEQKEQLALVEEENKRLVQHQTENISVIETKNSELESIVQKQDEKITIMEHKNKELESILEEKNEDFCEMERRYSEIQDVLENRNKQLSAVEMKSREMEGVIERQSEQLREKESKIRELQQLFDGKCEECENLTENNERLQGDMSILSKTMKVIETKLEHVEKDLARKCDECHSLSRKNAELDNELTLSVKEQVDLTERIDSLLRYNQFLYDKLVTVTYTGYQLSGEDRENERLEVYEAEVEDLRQQLDFLSSQEQRSHKDEAEKYKKLYEELQTRIEPFMEQLDAFELEKQFLLGRSQATEEEMEKMKQNYCDLLGHQNKKQKIKHIVKLKDENTALRKEVAALREQTVRQQRMIEKSSQSSRGKGNALQEKSTVSSRGKENAPVEKSTVTSKGKENTPKKSQTPLKSRQQTENSGR